MRLCFSAFYLWDDYSEEEFFVQWLGLSLTGFVFPIAAKKLFFWIKNGFSEGQSSETAFQPSPESSVNARTEPPTMEGVGSADPADRVKLLSANFLDRYFARCIDLPIFMVVFAVGSILIPASHKQGEDTFFIWFILDLVVSAIVACITMVLWETFWISRCGATPGKMLLGLVVKDKNGARPSWETAKTRAAGLLCHGFYYFIFFPESLILSSFFAWLRPHEMQPWDDLLGTRVRQIPIGMVRRIAIRVIAIVLIFSVLLIWFVFKQITKQQIRDEIRLLY